MTFYRIGMRLKMTRAAARRAARSGSARRTADAVERMVQTGKSRFGGSVGRPLAASLSTLLDGSAPVFHTDEFLFFNDGEDDDGT